MKKKVLALALAITTAMSLAGCGGNSGSTASTTAAAASAETAAAAPSNSGAETIKIICPYGVGGTADVIARKYALVAGKTHPEYNFIVENMTGGDGFAAANYYTDQDASTREILVYGYGVAYRHDLGRKYNTEVVDFDRADIYPVATVDDRTWIMYTTPAQTLESILAKAKEGGIKMSGGNPDGEVDVFVGTTQAALEDVEAGTMIPILAFSESAFEGFKGPDGDIPVPGIAGHAKAPELDASKDYTGSILAAGGFVAVRTGADQAWIDEIVQISKDVWADAEYSDWISEIMLNKCEIYGEDAVKHLESACEKAVAAFDTLSGQ